MTACGEISAPATSGRVSVRGLAPGGGVRFEGVLTHGWSPSRLLRAAGWRPLELRGYEQANDGRVVIEYSVLPTATHGRYHDVMTQAPAAARGPQAIRGVEGGAPNVHDTGVEADTPVTYQRLAAYAVVTGPDGVLLTELSNRTSRAGLWVLPGGGVEPGETVADAVVREVWEESGQEIVLGPLVDVSTSHRVGEFHGGLEDFHAVRMIFSASCDEPGPLVVHDVEGSTGRAAWFPVDAITGPGGPSVSGGLAPWATDAVRKASLGVSADG